MFIINLESEQTDFGSQFHQLLTIHLSRLSPSWVYISIAVVRIKWDNECETHSSGFNPHDTVLGVDRIAIHIYVANIKIDPQ